MNTNCNGDFYKVNGRQFYRCLLDSSVVRLEESVQICPNCRRRVDAAFNEGDVQTRTVVVTQVYLQGAGWIRHAVMLFDPTHCERTDDDTASVRSDTSAEPTRESCGPAAAP